MQDYASRQRQPQRHAVGLALVVVLHLLLLWVIQSGLSREVTRQMKVVVDAVLLTEDKPAPPPPAAPKNLPPPPKNVPPPPPAYVPPVEVPVSAPPAANAIAAVSNTPAPPAPAVAAPVAPGPKAEPVRTAAVVSGANCKIDKDEDYPRASKRLEEEGTVSVRMLIGADGRVAEVVIEKSSGFKRLDDATKVFLMNPSKCAFKPATTDGKPEPSWASMKFTWRLE